MNVIDPRSYGIDFYGDNLFTTVNEVDEHPERVDKMIRATLKGWAYALAHKDEIIDLILTKYNPDLNRDQLHYEAKVIDQMIVPDLVPIGEINPRRYDHIARTFHQLGMSTTSSVPDGFIYASRTEPTASLTTQERAWLTAHPDIRLVFPQGLEPNLMKDDQGRLTGLLADYWNLLNSRLGTDVQFQLAPMSDIPKMIKEKRVEGMLFASPKLIEAFDLIGAGPVIQSYVVIYGRQTKALFRFPRDLFGKKVAVLKGYDHTDHAVSPIRGKADLIEVGSPLEGLKATHRGKVDFFIGSIGNNYTVSKSLLIGMGPVHVFWDHPYSAMPAVRSDLPELASILSKGTDLVSKEEFNAIVGKWTRVQQLKNTIDLTPEERAWLKAHPVITLGSPIITPWNFVDEKTGSYEGIVPDYLDLIGGKLGITLKNISDDFGKIHQTAREKKIDGIGVAGKTAERAEFLNFSEPYITLQYSIVTQTESAPVATFADLAHKRVGILEASAAHSYLKKNYPDVTLVTFKAYDAGLLAVLNGEIDAWIGSLAGVAYAINNKGLFGLKMAVVPFEMSKKMGVGIRKDWPELIPILNKAIASIDQKEHSIIRSKWLAYPHANKKEKQVVITPEERAWLKSHPDITLGYADSFEPMLIVNDDDTFSGIYVDILEIMNQRLGTNIGLRIGSVPEILEQAKQKEIDGLLSLHPDYAAKLGLLATVGYNNSYPTVFARKEANFNGPADFAGKKVAIIDKIYFSEAIIRQYGGEADIVRVTNADEGLQKVQNGSVDFFVGLAANNFMLQKYRLSGLASKYTFFDYTTKFRYAVRSDWPTLVSILNKGISSFSEQEIETFVKKWVDIPKKEKSIALTHEERVWLKAHPEITIAYPGDYSPYSFQGQSGEFQGISVDLVNEIARRAGLKLRTYPDGNWTSLYLAAQKREIDAIGGIIKRPERDQWFEFTQPYLSTSQYIVTRKEQTDIQHRNDIAGKTLALVKGYATTLTLLEEFPTVKPHYVDSVEAAFEAVSLGKADATLGVMGAVQHFIAKKGIQNLRFAVRFSEKITDWRISVRKDRPLLRSIFDKALASISHDERQQIFLRWTTMEVALSEAVQSVKENLRLTDKERAWLAQDHIVRVRLAQHPPYSFTENGELVGIAIDFINKVRELTGIKFQFAENSPPFRDDLQRLIRHEGPDLIPAIDPKPEREQFILFTQPYVIGARFIFTRDDAEFVASMADLSGKTVAVIKGHVVPKELSKNYPDIKPLFYKNNEQALRAVSSGKAFAFIGGIFSTPIMINKFRLINLKAAAPSPLPEGRASMGICAIE